MKILHLNREVLNLLIPSFIMPSDISKIIESDFRFIDTYSNGKELSYFQIALIDNVVAGYSWTYIGHNTLQGKLANIRVSYEHRKKGVATSLVKASVWICQIHNVPKFDAAIKGDLPEHFGLHRVFMRTMKDTLDIKFRWAFNGIHYGNDHLN